jgi:DNA-directed RNA polymerase omega subunit
MRAAAQSTDPMEIPMDNIPDRIDSRFRYVLLAAERAEQMMRGARTQLVDRTGKVTRVAMEEITENLIEWGYGPAPQESEDDLAATAVEG